MLKFTLNTLLSTKAVRIAVVQVYKLCISIECKMRLMARAFPLVNMGSNLSCIPAWVRVRFPTWAFFLLEHAIILQVYKLCISIECKMRLMARAFPLVNMGSNLSCIPAWVRVRFPTWAFFLLEHAIILPSDRSMQ